MRLSKSRYTAGLQCDRMLWWRVHEPDASELVPDAAQQAIFDQGSRVGRAACRTVRGGVLIDFPHTAIAERLEATEAALRDGARAVFEASFIADDTFVAVDILERTRGGWRLIEVKSSTRVKPEHLPDVAVQLHVLRRHGLSVGRAQLMHLNRACTYPDLDDLFAREDVTAGAEALLDEVPGEISRQLRMLRGPLPERATGPHCDSPYECPFKDRCWPEVPEHHISSLYRVGSKAWDLESRGIATIHDLPDDYPLNPVAARQVRSVRSGRMVVEPGLGAVLDALPRPIAVLDFETVNPAIPAWNGCHPYDPVPAQFSCHVEGGEGGWTHHEWLADGPEDPRPEIVRRLTRVCRGAGTILAYSSDFESRCLRLIGEALPDHRAAVDRIVSRIGDALPIVRDHVYHPGFGGSFSLKSVLPALVPDLGYEGMEVADGNEASRVLERLMLGDPMPADERARLRAALLEYCRLDTWGVVKLIERLRGLARRRRGR